jgi:hypothetical protein
MPRPISISYGVLATATATEKNTGKSPRYSAKNENYRENRPENRENGLYEPENAIFRLFLRVSRPPDMKSRKNQSIEQWAAGYDPQAAAMRTLPHGAHLSSTARGSSPEP